MLEKRDGYQVWIKSGFRRSTIENYKLGYGLFIRFMNETEGGHWDDKRLIGEREKDLRSRSFVFEQKVLEFYEWMKGLVQQDREVLVQRKNAKPYTIKIKGGKKLADNTRQVYTHGVRSFFSFHRLDLKLTRQQSRILNREPQPVMKYYEFTLEDIKRMARVAKPKERYVLLVGRSIGLRGGDFVLLKQGSFLAHLDEDPPCSLGEIFTTKEATYAKPFLDADAKEAAEAWLTILRAQGGYPLNFSDVGKSLYGADSRMIEIGEEELTEIIKKLVKKAGIQIGNERVRFHQLRVFLITRLSKVMEENRWKQIVGKKVPEKAYVKPFEIRDDFRKVIPLIAVSNQSVIGSEELIKLRGEVERLHTRLSERTDPLLNDIERLTKIPGGREFFSEIVADAKAKLARVLEKQKLE